jgi:NADPH:quinone reductase-like Zn-dependent oxidoreductase
LQSKLRKYFRAEVTDVDNSKNFDMLRSIGAYHVIDYTQEDFTKNGQQHYDLILDIAEYHSIFDYRRALSSSGIYSLVGGSRLTIFQTLLLGPLLSLAGSKKMSLMARKPNNKEDLDFIKSLLNKVN